MKGEKTMNGRQMDVNKRKEKTETHQLAATEEGDQNMSKERFISKRGTF